MAFGAMGHVGVTVSQLHLAVPTILASWSAGE